MLSVNISPLKLLNTTLATTLGTTKGREAFDLILINSFNLQPIFLKTLQATSELCSLGNLLESSPYFWNARKENKIKIAEEGKQLYLWGGVDQKGITSFCYDIYFRPLKALTKIAEVISRTRIVIKIAIQFFGLKFEVGNGHQLMAMEHGLKALLSLHYLYHLNEDKSRSFTKGMLSLLSESLLTLHSLSQNRYLGLMAGVVQVAAQGYIETRKKEKEFARDSLIAKLPEPPVYPMPEDEWPVVQKFLFRLFQTPYFVLSLADIEQFARTLFCINGFGDSFSYLSSVKKHPIFSHFSLAGYGMYGLVVHKYVTYWSDDSIPRSFTGLLFLGTSICDSLFFLNDNGLIEVTKQIGKLLVVKGVLMTLACSMLVCDSIKARSVEKTPLTEEGVLLEEVNNSIKAVLTLNSAATHYGRALPKLMTIFLGSLFGFNQVARGLYWQRLNDKRKIEGEKKLVNCWENRVQGPTLSSDRKTLAEKFYL